jgi:hypothetical protein
MTIGVRLSHQAVSGSFLSPEGLTVSGTCSMTLVSTLLHHYFSNKFDVRAILQRNSAELLNAFSSIESQMGSNRAILDKAPDALTEDEREFLNRIEDLLLTSLAHLEEQTRGRSVIQGFYDCAFENEDNRRFFLDHLAREQLRKVVVDLMSSLKNNWRLQYSVQFVGDSEIQLHVDLRVGGLSRHFMVDYELSASGGSLAKDLPVIRELADGVCADLKGIVKDLSNWPTLESVKTDATKVQELSQRIFSKLSKEELTLLGRHPKALNDALLQAVQKLQEAPTATGEDLAGVVADYIKQAQFVDAQAVEEEDAVA